MPDCTNRGTLATTTILISVPISALQTLKVKMDLREIEWDGMNWIDLVQDRDQWRALVNTVMNLSVP
jgi:hypothetical protein